MAESPLSVGAVGYLVFLWFALSLAGTVATQVLKMPGKLLIKRRLKPDSVGMEIYGWLTSMLAVGTCGIAAVVPGTFPLYVALPWKIILGTSSGLFSVIIYRALLRAIPALIERLPESIASGIRGLFGGFGRFSAKTAAVQATKDGISEIDFETLASAGRDAILGSVDGVDGE